MSTRQVVAAVIVLVVAAGAVLYSRRGGEGVSPLIGMVRQTEIRIAPEVSGRLASIAVAPGQHVKRGDLLAVIDNPDSTARFRADSAVSRPSINDRASHFCRDRGTERSRHPRTSEQVRGMRHQLRKNLPGRRTRSVR